MRSFLAAFTIATAVAIVLTPFMRSMAFRLGAVAAPGARHVHKHSTPRLGGVAIFFAFIAPLLGLYFVDSSVARAVHAHNELVFGLLAGAFAMCGLGFIDDVKGLRAWHKLLAQVVVAVFAYFCGFRIDSVSLPFVGDAYMGIFALPVTVLWIVGIVNAVNLIDGLDGLAGGVVFFAALTGFIVAYMNNSVFIAAVMACLLGAVLGFLFFNFNPARIFMGDSGSYLLGFVLAATSICGAGRDQKTSTTVALLVPIIALGVPIFDTLFAIVRRFLERRSLFSPDRSHIHHRLVDMGMTQRRAVLILYAASILLTFSSLAVALGRDWQVGVALVCATVVLFGLVRFVGAFQHGHLRRLQKEHIRSSHVEKLRRSMPGLLPAFTSARSREDLLKLLESFSEEIDMSRMDLLRTADAKEELLRRWENPAKEGRREGALVSARFPVPNAPENLEIKFVWHSELFEVSPQADILLQIVVDMIDGRLLKLPALEAVRPTSSRSAHTVESSNETAVHALSAKAH